MEITRSQDYNTKVLTSVETIKLNALNVLKNLTGINSVIPAWIAFSKNKGPEKSKEVNQKERINEIMNVE